MQKLNVVNDMLGTMGEAPLNSLTDSHEFRGSCLRVLDQVSRRVQARGWYFNREKKTLSPQPSNGHIVLSNDILEVRADPYWTDSNLTGVVKRGSRLYNTDGGTYVFDKDVDCILIRLVQFEDLPEVAAQHIAATAVASFQRSYDGDSTKTRQLTMESIDQSTDQGTLLELRAEEIRQAKANMLRNNVPLQNIKRLVRGPRTVYRRW